MLKLWVEYITSIVIPKIMYVALFMSQNMNQAIAPLQLFSKIKCEVTLEIYYIIIWNLGSFIP